MIIKLVNTSVQSFTWIVGTTIERVEYANGLGISDKGKIIWYDTDDDTIYIWNGSNWV